MSQFVDNTYSRGVRVVEALFPGPKRLGTPLPAPPAAEGGAGTGTTTAFADPVVLVHGMGCSPHTFVEWARSLRADGADVTIAQLPNHAMGDIDESARVLSPQVDAVLQRTGAGRVDMVGFSEGGLIARHYVEDLGGAPKVDSLVTVATPNHGSRMATTNAFFDRHPRLRGVLPVAMQQMTPDGPEITRRSDPAVVQAAQDQGVRYTSIRNPGVDGFVAPAASPEIQQEGVTNIVLEPTHTVFGHPVSPNHYSVVHNSNAAYEAMRGALLTPRPAAVPAAR